MTSAAILTVLQDQTKLRPEGSTMFNVPPNSLEAIRDQFNSDDRLIEYQAVEDGVPLPSDTPPDPYISVRQELLLDLLPRYHEGGKVLEIGSSIGTLTAKLIRLGLDVHGIEIAERMARLGRERLRKMGADPARISVGNVFDLPDAAAYDVIVADGVLWYYKDRLPFLRKIVSLLRPGGVAFVGHRNQLFDLFALNQGTLQFVHDQLLDHLDEESRTRIVERLAHDVAGLDQPVHRHITNRLNKFGDNPLTLRAMYEQVGLELLTWRAVYVHTAPPRSGDRVASTAEAAGLQNRYGDQWQGLFLGSQFLVVARKAAGDRPSTREHSCWMPWL